MPVTIRQLQSEDCSTIAQAFAQQGWDKPESQYRDYLQQQRAGDRRVLLAFYDNTFAGYVTVTWQSHYKPFRELQIPEIMDLNVLKAFQSIGIATALLDEAETLVAERSDIVGIGVGLISDYGPAQSVYIQRGYVPDKRGISQNGIFPGYGDTVVLGDDVALYLTKRL